jgi:hypothetical protein
MATALDQYFAFLGSDGEPGPELDQLGALFALDAEVSYGGERAIGEWIVPFHRHVLSRRRHSEHTFSTTVGPDGGLTTEWHETGVDRSGADYRASGTATARLDAAGRITRLSVSFAEHTDWAWRIVRRHSEAWFEADPPQREAKMKKVYAKDLTFVGGKVIQGLQALNELSGKSQELQPIALARIGEVLRAHEYVLYEWHSMTTIGDEVTGWEMQRVDENEQIDHIVMFVNTGTVVIP